MAATHDLKIWPKFYEDVAFGAKRFELRKNDRDFKVGDNLVLREWAYDLTKGADVAGYTGREVRVRVTYVLEGPKFGLENGFCIMSFRMLPGARDKL